MLLCMRTGMKTILLTVLITLAIAACSPFSPATVKRFALVYGISDYVSPIPPIAYGAADAGAVAAVLAANGYTVIVRTNAEASVMQLTLDAASTAAAADGDDIVLFYFSGHGVDRETYAACVSNSGYGTSMEAGLLLFGSEGTLASNICANTIGERSLSSIFAGIAARKKIAVLDACYSGTFIDAGKSVDAYPADYTNAAVDIAAVLARAIDRYAGIEAGNASFLTISAAGNEAAWDGFRGHGVFTYFFLGALTDGDLNSDGCITTLEAYAYTGAAIEAYWNVPDDGKWSFYPRISPLPLDYVLLRK